MCFQLEICISEKRRGKKNENIEPFFFTENERKRELKNVYPYGENFSPKRKLRNENGESVYILI